MKISPFSGKSIDVNSYIISVDFAAIHEKKVVLALMGMTEGAPKRWAENYVKDRITNHNTALDTWKDWVDIFTAVFKDPNEEITAQRNLMRCKQKESRAEEFLMEFEGHARTAKYLQGHDN